MTEPAPEEAWMTLDQARQEYEQQGRPKTEEDLWDSFEDYQKVFQKEAKNVDRVTGRFNEERQKRDELLDKLNTEIGKERSLRDQFQRLHSSGLASAKHVEQQARERAVAVLENTRSKNNDLLQALWKTHDIALNNKLKELSNKLEEKVQSRYDEWRNSALKYPLQFPNPFATSAGAVTASNSPDLPAGTSSFQESVFQARKIGQTGAVLVLFDSFSPVHTGHIEALYAARRFLVNYSISGAVLCLAKDELVADQALSLLVRLDLCRRATAAEDWIDVCEMPFDSSQEAVAWLETDLRERGKDVDCVVVCDAVDVPQARYDHGLIFSLAPPLVVVGQFENLEPLKSKPVDVGIDRLQIGVQFVHGPSLRAVTTLANQASLLPRPRFSGQIPLHPDVLEYLESNVMPWNLTVESVGNAGVPPPLEVPIGNGTVKLCSSPGQVLREFDSTASSLADLMREAGVTGKLSTLVDNQLVALSRTQIQRFTAADYLRENNNCLFVDQLGPLVLAIMEPLSTPTPLDQPLVGNAGFPTKVEPLQPVESPSDTLSMTLLLQLENLTPVGQVTGVSLTDVLDVLRAKIQEQCQLAIQYRFLLNDSEPVPVIPRQEVRLRTSDVLLNGVVTLRQMSN